MVVSEIFRFNLVQSLFAKKVVFVEGHLDELLDDLLLVELFSGTVFARLRFLCRCVYCVHLEHSIPLLGIDLGPVEFSWRRLLCLWHVFEVTPDEDGDGIGGLHRPDRHFTLPLGLPFIVEFTVLGVQLVFDFWHSDCGTFLRFAKFLLRLSTLRTFLEFILLGELLQDFWIRLSLVHLSGLIMTSNRVGLFIPFSEKAYVWINIIEILRYLLFVGQRWTKQAVTAQILTWMLLRELLYSIT